jgi:hypothetical protein
MGGVGYRHGCGNGATAKAEQKSFSQNYGNQEKVRRRILVRLTINSEDLPGLNVIDAVLFGPRQKIIPSIACFMARLLRYIHPHVYRYAQVDVPCRQTIIRRNCVELFLTVTLCREEPFLGGN